MKKAILLDTKLSSITPSFKRPEDERHLSFDVQSFNQDEFELPANNSTGTNGASSRILPQILTFAYLYVPYSVELTINDSLVLPRFTGIFVLSASLNSIKIRNLAIDRSVVCSIVFA